MVRAIILALILTGCTSVKVVKVPVPVFPEKITLPERPALYSSSISDATENDAAVKFILSDMEALISYSKQLERLLDTVNNASNLKFNEIINKEIIVE